MKVLSRLMALCMAFAALAGCGGGGSGSASTSTAQGVFVDAPVEGLTYVSGGIKGTTKAGGVFTYEVGKPVKFMVGDVVLGEAAGAPVITPVELVKAVDPTATATDVRVVNMVRFLLTVNGNGDATEIVIPSSVTIAAAGKSLDFANDAQLATVVAQVAPDKTLVDAVIAEKHLAESLAELGQGLAGAYVLSDGDTFASITIDADGNIYGSVQNIYAEYYGIKGTVTPTGALVGKSEVKEGAVLATVYWTGTVAPDGTISITSKWTESGVEKTGGMNGFKMTAVDARYTGSYFATINNDTSAQINVQADGSVSGTAYNIYGGSYYIGGAVSPTGDLRAEASGEAMGVIKATLDGAGNISGSIRSLERFWQKSPDKVADPLSYMIQQQVRTSNWSGKKSDSPYAGFYFGDFRGTTSSGYCLFGVDADGTIVGFANDGTYSYYAKGNVQNMQAADSAQFTVGLIDATSGKAAASLTGAIAAADGSVSGSWRSLETSETGTFGGKKMPIKEATMVMEKLGSFGK
ncbi:MAG: hypothetical protein HYS23_14730 [Geobacter sp.]|nr:hypothetical protein [Geobacter sp.]